MSQLRGVRDESDERGDEPLKKVDALDFGKVRGFEIKASPQKIWPRYFIKPRNRSQCIMKEASFSSVAFRTFPLEMGGTAFGRKTVAPREVQQRK